MRDDIAKSLLSNVITDIVSDEEMIDYIKYFQTMAKYKYDDYQQFATGLRFIENMAIWLSQFNKEDRKIALDFVHERLVFISTPEINLLAVSCFPDRIREILINETASKYGIQN